MSSKYLLDTNVIIRAFHPSSQECSFVSALPLGQVFVSAATIAEFYVKANREEMLKFEELVVNIVVLDIDEEIAKKAGGLRKASLKKNKAYLQDCYIAATALIHGCHLVTNNTKDFKFRGLKVINP